MYFNYRSNKIYFEKFGNKKETLIILPGWGDNRKTFKNIIDNLKEKFTIYIFDYPGFGKSSIPKEELTIYNYAEIIIKFMNKNNIINPIILGHSFGGRVITVMNGYYNINFKKIILIDAAGIKPQKKLTKNFKQNIYKLLKKISIILPKKIKEKYLDFLISIFGSRDYKMLPKGLRNTFINIVNEDLTKYLKNINSETLIIWGENDIDTPLEDGKLMNSLIKDSALIIIKKATHFCYLEYPSYIKIVLDEYLKGEN